MTTERFNRMAAHVAAEAQRRRAEGCPNVAPKGHLTDTLRAFVARAARAAEFAYMAPRGLQ